ncbi:MAG: toprim domain-containing protein [Candidatus Paceibacterota bacterium]
MDSRERLTNAFKHFPGIGPRQAKRFVYFLLSRGSAFTGELAKELGKLHENVARCEITHQHFQKTDPKQTRSQLAQDESRDHSRLLVVETDMDLEAIESTGAYNGMYFVLGTHGSLTDDDLSKRAHLQDLQQIIATHYNSQLEELIIATSVTPEGERLRETVAEFLENTADDLDFQISTLGRGLSTGTELEYIDENTFKYALEGRN